MELLSLPAQDLSEHENRELVEALNSPIIAKYLKVLAYNTACQIALTPIGNDESSKKYIRKHQEFKGRLLQLEDLLSSVTLAIQSKQQEH